MFLLFQFITKALKHGLDVLLDRKSQVEAHHSGSPHVCPHKTDLATDVASRPRQSPYPMITVKQAQEIILSHAKVLPAEEIKFNKGTSRILAENIVAKDPLPPFPASIKDGYAVKSSDQSLVKKGLFTYFCFWNILIALKS